MACELLASIIKKLNYRFSKETFIFAFSSSIATFDAYIFSV